jgi:hypothetical protein
VGPYVVVVMGSGRECGAICGSGDGEWGVRGIVGLHVGVVLGSTRECGAMYGSGDGEWEGERGYVREW